MDVPDDAISFLLQAFSVFFHERPFFLLPPLGSGKVSGMGHISRLRLIVYVLIILGLSAAALAYQKGGRISEWVTVNLFTVSTKAKQEKYLELALRHMDEPALFAEYLRQSEYMAEVILYLDGSEIAVAERFEEATRKAEEYLARKQPFSYESLIAAQIENEKMFRYMASNYQFNDADIKKYQDIIEKHIIIAENLTLGNPDPRISALLAEAKKHQAAGLNVEGYELVKKAKNIVYTKLVTGNR